MKLRFLLVSVLFVFLLSGCGGRIKQVRAHPALTWPVCVWLRHHSYRAWRHPWLWRRVLTDATAKWHRGRYRLRRLLRYRSRLPEGVSARTLEYYDHLPGACCRMNWVGYFFKICRLCHLNMECDWKLRLHSRLHLLPIFPLSGLHIDGNTVLFTVLFESRSVCSIHSLFEI